MSSRTLPLDTNLLKNKSKFLLFKNTKHYCGFVYANMHLFASLFLCVHFAFLFKSMQNLYVYYVLSHWYSISIIISESAIYASDAFLFRLCLYAFLFLKFSVFICKICVLVSAKLASSYTSKNQYKLGIDECSMYMQCSRQSVDFCWNQTFKFFKIISCK